MTKGRAGTSSARRRLLAWGGVGLAAAALVVVLRPAEPPPGEAPLVSAISPDGRYRLEGHAVLGREESHLLLRVQDLHPGGGLAVYRGRFVNGAFRPGWDCSAAGCSGFWWSARDQDRIDLPPGWPARWRGRLSQWIRG